MMFTACSVAGSDVTATAFVLRNLQFLDRVAAMYTTN
jgi:hypothetical protein